MFLIWLILNLVINREYFAISAFQVVKFIELVLLVIFVYFNLQNSKVFTKSLFIFTFSGFLQSLIAIYQFVTQYSAFSSSILAKITGESVIGPQIPGVAKIVVDGEKIIRAYGTFPHSNILGGFLVFTILITIYLYLEHKKNSLSSIELNLIPKNLDICADQKRHLQVSLISALFTCIIKSNLFYSIKHNKSQIYTNFLFWVLLLSAQFVGLFFTFSRSAWFGLFISLFIISAFYFYNYKNVSCETNSDKIYSHSFKIFLKNIKFFISSKTEIINLYQNTVKNFYKHRIVSHETISTKFYTTSSLFIVLVKVGAYFYNKIKLILQILILLVHNQFSWNYNKKAPSALKCCENKFQYDKNEEILNTANKRDSTNNINLLNKLLTVFQHNFYMQSIVRHKELFIALIIIIIVISVNFSLALSRLDINLYNENLIFNNFTINERIFYNNVSRETISSNFVSGSGIGTSIFQIDNYLQINDINQKLQPWQYQPAHNIYLLIASEIGIMGLILFLLLIVSVLYNLIHKNLNIYGKRRRTNVCLSSESKNIFCNKIDSLVEAINNIVSHETISSNIFNNNLNKNNLADKNNQKNPLFDKSRGVFKKLQDHNFKLKNKIVSCETIDNNLNIYLFAILTAFLFIGLFDHYFWTLQQGRLIFWLVLGLILAMSDCKK